jgi:hypothetical protein
MALRQAVAERSSGPTTGFVERADALDLDRHLVAVREEDRRLASHADAGWRPVAIRSPGSSVIASLIKAICSRILETISPVFESWRSRR